MVNLLQRSGMLVVFASGIAVQATWGQVSSNKNTFDVSQASATAQDSSAGQRARLIRNPKKNDGLPPFALTDQHGAIQRYVEPVEGIDLKSYVGQVVIVQHDTGRTLLASQLVLPTAAKKDAVKKVAGKKDTGDVAPATSAVVPAPAASRDLAVEPAHFLSPVSYEPVDFEEVQPDLAVPESVPEPIANPTIQAPNAAPVWTEEQLPPGGEAVYIDGPHGTGFGGHYGHENYGNGNYGCCSHCDGGSHCSHCPRRSRNYDRGLLAGVFDDSCRPEGCAPGARGRYYLRGEYLYWTFDGMDVPRLVGGGDIDGMGTPGTDDDQFALRTILYGDSEILDGFRDGSRITFGWFRDPCGLWAVEGDYLHFSTASDYFFAEGDQFVNANGDFSAFDGQAIGRPFFRVPQRVVNGQLESVTAIEDVVTSRIGGSVAVDTHSDFDSFGLRLRHNLCCSSPCQTGCGDCCDSVGCGSTCGSSCGRGGYGTRRIDVSFGVRYARLDEGLTIQENLRSIDGTGFIVTDAFDTDNDFYGAEIGFNWEWEYYRWKLDLLSRLAVGNTHQQVAVNGSTVFINPAVPRATAAGGLLTQPGTNIGVRESDKLSVLPELGINVGYQLTANLHFTLGYSFMYWSSVVRPGDQIDLDVNPNLIARENAVTAIATANDRPRAFFNQTDFFAHGVNVGLEYRR